MKAAIVLFALIAVSSAFFVGKDIQDCFKERQKERNVCENTFFVILSESYKYLCFLNC